MTRTNPLLVPVLVMASLTAACGQDAAVARSPGEAETSAAPASTAGTATVDSLPLKRGYYVASETACDQAANADVMLVHRYGINASRTACEFTRIEATNPTTYRAMESCSDIQGGGPDDIRVVTYVLRGDTGFISRSEGGWTYSARYCAQASMPPDWRENDISDLID